MKDKPTDRAHQRLLALLNGCAGMLEEVSHTRHVPPELATDAGYLSKQCRLIAQELVMKRSMKNF